MPRSKKSLICSVSSSTWLGSCRWLPSPHSSAPNPIHTKSLRVWKIAYKDDTKMHFSSIITWVWSGMLENNILIPCYLSYHAHNPMFENARKCITIKSSSLSKWSCNLQDEIRNSFERPDSERLLKAKDSKTHSKEDNSAEDERRLHNERGKDNTPANRPDT